MITHYTLVVIEVGHVLVGEQYDFGVVRFLGDGPAAQVFAPVIQGGAANGD